MVPELLPLPIEPDELPEPVLGEVVELGDLVVLDELPPVPVELLPDELPLPMPLDEPLVLPLPELDLPKWASHSAREIWPSLLVSTDEKLGVVALSELELEGELELPPAALLDDLPLDELPDAPVDGVVADGEADEPLEDLASSAATARPDRTKSAAAVVMVTVLSI